MRVYVFVAIFTSVASFCFAIRLRSKACNDADLNGRDLLCTPVLKPDSISDGMQRHNVELVMNEAHLDDKNNEARMQNVAVVDSEKMISKWLDLIETMEESTHIAPALKKPRLEASSANQFALPQSIDPASHSNHLRNTAGEDIIFVLENSYYEGKTVMDWLKSVQASRIFPTSDDSIENYDNTKLLAILTEEIKPQPIVPQDVVDLFDTLQANPQFVSFAEDVQRTMVLDSMYKPLVFGQWIEKGYSPEKMLDIFFAHKSVDVKVTNPLFLAWLEYFTWYWRLVKSKSPLRYAEFLKALRKYLSEENLDKMISSLQFKEAFLKEQVEGVRDDFESILWTWHAENPDSPALLWVLNYVFQYRKQSTFSNIMLFKLLMFKLSFKSLMKLLRSQSEYPQLKILADDMLQFSSTTMLTTLAEYEVNPEEYFEHLFSLYGTAATSSEPETMETSQQNKSFDIALQYLKYALVFDVQIKKMTYENSISDSFIFLDDKMHDMLSQHSKELQDNVEKFMQDLGFKSVGGLVIWMMATCGFKEKCCMLSAAKFPLKKKCRAYIILSCSLIRL
ncbi:hypothetical protein Plhal304r1_c031g0100911 [Plasmopara halstedii]